MPVGYHLPGVSPEYFEGLTLRERGFLFEALADWIERLNEEGDATTDTRPPR